jgi:hypothetical protein
MKMKSKKFYQQLRNPGGQKDGSGQGGSNSRTGSNTGGDSGKSFRQKQKGVLSTLSAFEN